MLAREMSELSHVVSDFGTFDLSIRQAERSSDSQPILIRHYRCTDSTALQQLQQSYAFVQRYAHRSLGKVWAVERLGAEELVVYTDNLQVRVGEWVQNYESCPWTVEATLDQIAGLIEVLAEAQRSNVLHRRLSPDYIYSDENSIKLLDFSPCSFSTEDDLRFVTALPERYLSPERTARHWTCSFQSAVKADIYSLGVFALDLIYGAKAADQTAAGLLASLREVPQLHSLLEQMLREDPLHRPDFIRLQSYLKGEPEVPVQRVKVPLRGPAKFPAPLASPAQAAVVPPAVGGSESLGSCSYCHLNYQLKSEQERGMCLNCSLSRKSLESEVRQDSAPPYSHKPDLTGQPLSAAKEVNPLSLPSPKPFPFPQKQSSDLPIQCPVLPACEKCKKTFDPSPSPWRLSLCAHRSEAELVEIYKYCSVMCLPEILKVSSLPPAAVPVLSKAQIPAPKVAPPPIPEASEPMADVRLTVSQEFPNSQLGSRQSSQVAKLQGEPSRCAFCFRAFAPLHIPVAGYENYESFCSEDCQLQYFLVLSEDPTVSKMLLRKAQENCCLECSGGVEGGRAVVLPCSHQFCSHVCATNHLNRILGDLPAEARDLNIVITCPKCEKPISPQLIKEWQEGAVPKPFPDPVGNPPMKCCGCSRLGPVKSTFCGHWLCANCMIKNQTANGVKCPSCGVERPLPAAK